MDSGPSTAISQAEYARLRNISRQAVHDLVARGIITLVDGKIEPAEADKQLLALDPEKSKALLSLASQLELQPPAEQPNESPQGDGGDPAVTSYHVARTIREKYAAATAKMEYLKLIGTLVAAAEVRENEFRIFRKLRDNLTAISDRLAPRLAAETDPVRVQHLIGEEIRKALNELSRALGVDAAGGAGERQHTVQ